MTKLDELARLERLETERNIMENSFGHGPFRDGILLGRLNSLTVKSHPSAPAPHRSPAMADRKLTEAQRRILIDARDHGDVLANGPRKRSCALLTHMGLLETRKGRSRVLSDAGRALLASGREGK